MDHLDQRPPKPRRGEGARLDKKDATRTLFHGLLGLDIADKLRRRNQELVMQSINRGMA